MNVVIIYCRDREDCNFYVDGANKSHGDWNVDNPNALTSAFRAVNIPFQVYSMTSDQYDELEIGFPNNLDSLTLPLNQLDNVSSNFQ